GGSGGFGVQPRVILSYGTLGGVRVLANVGINLRGAQQLENVVVGNEFAWALAAEVPFRIGENRLAATANVYGVVGLHPGGSEGAPVEALLGIQAQLSPAWSLKLSAGKGLVRGYGSPDGRVVGGL